MRPTSFVNPHDLFGIKVQTSRIFEDGADEYERGLKEEGIFTYGCTVPNIEDVRKESGYWCFIPEDE